MREDAPARPSLAFFAEVCAAADAAAFAAARRGATEPESSFAFDRTPDVAAASPLPAAFPRSRRKARLPAEPVEMVAPRRCAVSPPRFVEPESDFVPVLASERAAA